MFPSWITRIDDDHYEINADVAFPHFMKELGVKDLDQYWLEVIYQCAKLDLRRLLLISGKKPWPRQIRIRGSKEKWAQHRYPVGRGSYAATKGKEAREIYRQLRGFIPN